MYSVSSVVESLQIMLINSCSVNSYILGVLKGGGELSVLLCHLGHFLPCKGACTPSASSRPVGVRQECIFTWMVQMDCVNFQRSAESQLYPVAL